MAVYGPFYATAGTTTSAIVVSSAIVPAAATAGTDVGIPWILPNIASSGTATISKVKLTGTVGRDWTLTVDWWAGYSSSFYNGGTTLSEVQTYCLRGNIMRIWKVQISNWTEWGGHGPEAGDEITFHTIGDEAGGTQAKAKFLGANDAQTEARFMIDYTQGGAPIIGERATQLIDKRYFDLDSIDYFDGETITVNCRGPGADQNGGGISIAGNSTNNYPDDISAFGMLHDTGRYLIIQGDPSQITSSTRGKFSESRYWIGRGTVNDDPETVIYNYLSLIAFNKIILRDLQFRNPTYVLEIWAGTNSEDVPNFDVADIVIDRCIFDGTNDMLSSQRLVTLTSPFSVSKPAIVVKMINCLLFNGNGASSSSGIQAAGYITSILYNCTIDGFATGILNVSQIVNVKNTVVSNSLLDAFDLFVGQGATWAPESTNNISDDDTAPGLQPSLNVTPTYQSGSDFHLHRDDIHARGAGADLSSDNIHAFYQDIDLQNRGVFGSWDIGYDESFLIPIYRHPDYTNYNALTGQDAGLVTLVDIELQGHTLRYASIDCVVPDGENERVYYGYIDRIGNVTESLRLSIGSLNAAVSSCSISFIPDAELRTLTPDVPIHGGIVTVRKWAVGIDIINTFVVMKGIIRDFSVTENAVQTISVENWEKDVDADIQQVEINSELWEDAKEDSYNFPYPVLYGQIQSAVAPEIISGVEGTSGGGGIPTIGQRLMLAGHSVGTVGVLQYVSDDVYTGTVGVLGIIETYDAQTNVYSYIEHESPFYWGKSCVLDIVGKRDNAYGRATELAFGRIEHPAEMAIDAVCDYAGYEYPEEVDLHAFSFLKQKREGYIFSANLRNQISVRNFVDGMLSQCLAFGYTRVGLFRVYPFDIDGAPKENLIEHGNLLSLKWSEGDPDLICHEIKLKYNKRYDKEAWKGKVIATHTDRHGSTWVRSECEDAKRLYGTKPTQVLPFNYIADDATANLVIDKLVELFTTMRILIEVEATYDAARIKIGDVFTVTHSINNWDRKKFIALSLSYGGSTITIKGFEV